MLASRRDVFVIDRFAFEPFSSDGYVDAGERVVMVDDPSATIGSAGMTHGINEQKKVSAACIKLLLDYCEEPAWTMSLPEYCAGIFHGRELQPGETAFDLLPDVQERLSADRLGFGHIYGSGER